MKTMTIRCSACGAPNPGHLDQCKFCDAVMIHALGGLGLLRAGNIKLDQAFLEFRKALRKNPHDPDVHFGLGAYFIRRALYKEALAHLKYALHFAPISSEIYYLKALTFALSRGWTNIQVKQCAEKAVHLNPRLKEAKSILNIHEGILKSRTARKDDDLKNSLKILQKARNFEIRDHYKYIYYFCGETLEHAHEWENAMKMYRAARDYGNDTAKVHVRLGMILKHRGRLKMALHEFEKAHKIDPRNGAVLRTLEALKKKIN